MILTLKDKLSEICLGYIFGERKKCPALREENNFLTRSASDLASSIRNGEITSVQLVEATINRINDVNGVLNAIVDGPFLEALDEAKTIDDRIARKLISEGFLIAPM